jgi:hypothetical protein
MLQTENRGGTLTGALDECLVEDWHYQTADGTFEDPHEKHRESSQCEGWPVRSQIL